MITNHPTISRDSRNPEAIGSRRDFLLTLVAPKATNEAFAAACADERERILAGFRKDVSEDLVEMEMAVGNPGMPISLETHHENHNGQVFLHTHCLVACADVSSPQALYEWVGDMRRALHV